MLRGPLEGLWLLPLGAPLRCQGPQVLLCSTHKPFSLSHPPPSSLFLFLLFLILLVHLLLHSLLLPLLPVVLVTPPFLCIFPSLLLLHPLPEIP